MTTLSHQKGGDGVYYSGRETKEHCTKFMSSVVLSEWVVCCQAGGGEVRLGGMRCCQVGWCVKLDGVLSG